jgi:hypothetical protein
MITVRRIRGRVRSAVLAATLVLGVTTSALGHRTEEYLRAARIGIEPDSVDVYLTMTPGGSVAEAVIRTMDHDLDGLVSANEQDAYARSVVGALGIDLDGNPLALRLVGSEFPPPAAFLEGTGTIRVHAVTGAPGVSSPGTHTLFFSQVSGGIDSAYLANALVPESARVEILGQRRNEDQSELSIDFSLQPGPVRAALGPLAFSLAATGLTVFFTRRWRQT